MGHPALSYAQVEDTTAAEQGLDAPTGSPAAPTAFAASTTNPHTSESTLCEEAAP
jgi:hypothetical protein